MSLILATTSAATFTVWLLLLWFVIIPLFAVVPIVYALSQVAGERAENLAYARGEQPLDDPDVVVDRR